MIQKSSHFSLSTLGLALLFVFTPKSAQALIWDGSVSNNWFTGSNWATGIIPVSGEDIFIGQTGRNNTFFPVLNAGQSVQGVRELRVGVNTTGSLRIENGSSLGSLSSYIGYASGSSGLATVSGSGSNLTVSDFYVGYGGEGQLQITNSGRVVATDSIIGTNSSSIGNVTVSGTASRWDNSGRLYVGSSGSGTLTITDGGVVSNAGSGYIGSSVGGIGLVTIRDIGSQWFNPAGLTVGHVNSGTLRVENGGTIIVGTGGYIGNAASSIGSVTITGLGSRWNSTAGLAVGFDGNGTLRVFDSGVVSNINGYIGFNSGSSGTATVSGTGSQWINSGILTVGRAGNGTLLVENDGLVSAVQVIGQGSLSLDGGALQALASGAHFIDFTGAGTFELLSGGGTIDSNGFEIGTSSTISGAGSLIKTGTGTLTLTAINTYTGNTDVIQGTLTLNGAGSISPIGAVDITNGATFQINETTSNSGNYTFANSLTGNGLLRVNLQADTNVFSFALSAGSGFAGTVALDTSTFSLANENTSALTNATLELGTGSFTTVGTGTQNIGNLKMAGGSLTFNGAVPPGPLTGQIATNNLDLSSGTIRVDIPTLVGVSNPAPVGGTNLLAQDDDLVLSQLIAANGMVSGSASNLTLADLDGNAVSSTTTLAITESSIAVANAKYGFDLTTGSANDGVYLGYGLTELDLISGQTLHLSPDVGAAASASTLSAKVTGLGSLDIDASTSADQTLTIDNSTNDYTGKTTTSAGNLVLGSNQALGQTSELAIAGTATIDVNGKTQSIVLLSGSGTLGINAGDLSITNGGDFSGAIIGTSGDLNLSGGTLTLTGNNTYTGFTTVSGGELAIGSGGVSGSYTGDIINNAAVSFNRSDAVTYAAEISGTGTVDKEGTGTLILAGDNTYTGDTTISAGTLQIGAGGTTGSLLSDIINDGSLAFNRSDAVTNQSLISGSGSLSQQGSGSLTLTEVNSYTGGTIITSGTLNLANDSAAGTGSIANNSALELSFNAGNLDNTITGAGSTLVSGNAVTITGVNTGYSGTWSITGSANIGSMDHLGAGSVNVTGLLNANPSSGNLNFNNVLTGNGTLAVNMGAASDSFSFMGTTGSGFTGTLQLEQSSFDLSAINADVLSNATLDLRNGSNATLSEDRSIGNLSLGGGALHVSMSSPTVAHILSVDHLNVDVTPGGLPVDIGTVNLDVASLSSGVVSGNFLDQDDVSTSGGIQVVSANTVSTSGKHLNLNLQGTAPVDTTYAGQSDGYGNDDISATYSYMAVSTANASLPNGAGLYVSYVLKSLETQTDLVLSTTGATNTSLGAQITGVGNVEILGNSDIITLLNGANDYSGQSLVSSGTLLFGADNVLGNTSGLTIANNATVNMNGMTQIIGEFTGDQDSLLNLNSGNLTITNGGNSQGSLSGAGNLTFSGGNMVINGSNAGLSAAVTIDSAASTQIDNILGLGTGSIVDEGTLVLVGLSGTLSNQISGGGVLDVNNSDVTLAGNNTGYTGTIDINSGSRLTVTQLLNLGSTNLFNDGELVLNQSGDETFTNVMTGSGVLTKSGMGTIRIDSNYAHTGGTNINAGTFVLETSSAELSGGGLVNVAAGATLGGYGKITGTVQNNGTLAVADAISGVTNGSGTLYIQGDLINHNTVKLAGNTVGNILNVSGNYSAASDLIINTVLGGDGSLTDKLIVQGNTSGHTNVTVYNQGGTGAQTVAGIEVIEVGGVSAGTFSLANRVAYGAYDYGLVQTGNNWYLQSKIESGIRAEVGAYLANQTAAKDMFTSSLYSRMGESLFATERSAQNHDLSSWIRVGGHVTENRAAGQIDQKIWSSNVQIGTDIANNIADTNRWHVGVMAGSGSASTRNKTDNKAEIARSDVDGYSVGVYGTWFADGKPASTGPYVDSWLQYGWYDNSVKGDGLAKEQNYDSSTLAASIEAGWGFKLYEHKGNQLILQPQVQLTYMHYDADDLTETNGTQVQNGNSDGLISRVGGRLYGNIGTQSGQQWQPFVEVNWLHDSSSEKVSMNGDSFGSDIPKDRLDVKIGVQAKANKDWSLWSYVGAQTGSNSYSRIEGAAGVRYQW